MSDQNAGPTQAMAGPPRQHIPPPLKTEEIRRATFLDDSTKMKYTEAFTQFWSIVNTKPPEDQDHKQAWAKLQEYSQKLRTMAQQHRQRVTAMSQNAQQRQNSSGQQVQSQRQQTQQPQAPPQAQQANQGPNAQNGQQQQQQQVPRPAGPQGIPQAVVAHVRSFQFTLPPNIQGTPEAEAKLKEMRQTYATQLAKMEQAKGQLQKIGAIMNDLRSKGQDIPKNLTDNEQMTTQHHETAKRWVDDFRRKQAILRQHVTNQQGQQQPQRANPASQQNGQQAPQQIQHAPNAQATSAPPVKAEGATAGPSQPPQQPPNTQQQQPQTLQPPSQTVNTAAARAAQATQSPASAGPPQQHIPQQQQAQPQQQNGPAMQQRHPAQGGMPQQPQQQQQQPNGMQFNRPQAMPQQQPQQQHMGPGGQQNSPQTQGPLNNNVTPLNHQQAMNAAARSYSDQRTATPQQAGPAGWSPGSRETPQSNTQKMPIPKTLNVASPSPVNMGPSRPTMGGPNNGPPGMMGQPVIGKMPTYTLEGDGERVLNKKKLDELVRQVTGSSENQAGETLSAEVEETMLQLADDFVDSIISTACKVSKLRDSNQLDIRDIQLVLERNYNIRVPGYASDEIRTVRKIHPAPGWNEKMKALQAAKIMGGKTDM